MMTSSTRVTPDAEVVFTEMQNGESVLLHLGTSQYFSLNQTGTVTWQSLEKGLSMVEISQVLEEKFDVTHDDALQSVLDLVDELAKERLVQLTDDLAGESSADG